MTSYIVILSIDSHQNFIKKCPRDEQTVIENDRY